SWSRPASTSRSRSSTRRLPSATPSLGSRPIAGRSSTGSSRATRAIGRSAMRWASPPARSRAGSRGASGTWATNTREEGCAELRLEGRGRPMSEIERLAALLRLLPPAPPAWVRAAQELPHARLELEEIVARAEADAVFRQVLLGDLESALADA